MDTRRELELVDVFVQGRYAAAEPQDGERPDSTRLQPCLDLHGIRRERSYLARDGRRMLCHFRAPDAESLRVALRVAGIDYDALWTGSVNHFPGAAELVLVVERHFDSPLSEERERACRVTTSRRLLELGAEPARIMISRCRKRLLWLCRAATAEVVRAAEIELAAPGFEVWGCEP